jgi:hypothetical protein
VKRAHEAQECGLPRPGVLGCSDRSGATPVGRRLRQALCSIKGAAAYCATFAQTAHTSNCTETSDWLFVVTA